MVAAIAITALSYTGDEHQLRARQEGQETAAVAVGAAATYAGHGWRAELAPVMAAAGRLGAAAQVRDSGGHIVRSAPGFARLPATAQYQAPVIVGGRRVGLVALRFGSRGLAAVLARFNAQRWRARIIGAAAGALLAFIAAVLVAPHITGPLDRLLGAARARGSGRPEARVGHVRGFGDLRELAGTFDQMADVLGRQDQLRRTFVADVAHELRTPAAVIQAGTEAMLDRVIPPTPGQVESLHEEAVRLGAMIDDLQRLASAEAAAMQLNVSSCDLARTAEEAAGTLTDVFGREGVSLERRLTGVQASCDQRRMHDVVRNLLTNAAKYTPAGGTVLLETWPDDGHALLRVTDTGIGIPPDELPHITERFYRGNRSAATTPGSGIGLAIVDELIRSQRGAMDIASTPGQGTQVTIKLPPHDAVPR